MRFVNASPGEGKTTAIITEINARHHTKFICVVPSLDEVKRFQECLSRDKMVFLTDELVWKSNGKRKTELFHQAVENQAEVIVVTHALFLDFLEDTYSTLNYELIIDEVPLSFQKSETGWAIPEGLKNKQVIDTTKISENLTWFTFNDEYQDEDYSIDTAGREAQKFIKELKTKDVFLYKGQNVIFSLKLDKLSLFADVTILGYLWEHTDFWFWCQWKNLEVEHMTVNEYGVIVPHDGHKPSGKQFKDHVEIIRSKRPALKKGFSFSWQKDHLQPKKVDSKLCSKNCATLRAELRAIFKNDRDKKRFSSNQDFMFICAKDSIEGLIYTKGKLGKRFIDKEKNWVYSTIRGTNKFGHKHNVAYLMNIFPFPPVEFTIASLCPEKYDVQEYRDTLALSQMIQALWRSAIRNGEKVRIYCPSERMANILKDWLGRS